MDQVEPFENLPRRKGASAIESNSGMTDASSVQTEKICVLRHQDTSLTYGEKELVKIVGLSQM